ncbi:hypothetical protein BC332_25198 [Capsicum chinense]|nr:hypothetical protein BC332_25198 [Capsicum chinense]
MPEKMEGGGMVTVKDEPVIPDVELAESKSHRSTSRQAPDVQQYKKSCCDCDDIKLKALALISMITNGDNSNRLFNELKYRKCFRIYLELPFLIAIHETDQSRQTGGNVDGGGNGGLRRRW